MVRLDVSALDYTILAIYFVFVLGIGVVARLAIKTDLDFFLSGRSLPAWITGLAFVAANLGALEILGIDGLRMGEGNYWLTEFLGARASTIYTGTSEIQRNILAERVLGLPRGGRN